MKLSVPFIPDTEYQAFLTPRKTELGALYFSLGTGLDSRVQPSPWTLDDLIPGLAELRPLPSYALVNSRFIAPDHYRDTPFLLRLLDQLARLRDQAGLTGVVITDMYLLHALADTGHGVIPSLEAVPGINCMIHTPAQAMVFLDTVAASGFKSPGRFLLDRSLNRNPTALGEMVRVLKADAPGMDLELLANEGCLAHCPFKLSHDALISLSNTGSCREQTQALNQAYGCRRVWMNQPWKIFSSPFIRPEDLHHYQDLVQGVKLCGRSLGPKFLMEVIDAYIARSFDGNLLTLLDAASLMAHAFHLDNKALDPDFFTHLTLCTNQCKQCRVCGILDARALHPKPAKLKHYEDIL